MLLGLILALLLGVLAGTITGLLPGIHINLVSVFLLAVAGIFSGIQPITFVVFIVAMSIVHTFLDFIPSIFLGAPDEDSVLSVLPGHEMLIQGNAYEAVVLTLIGGFSAIIIVIAAAFPIVALLPIVYPYLQTIMPLILILASFFLIYFEKHSKPWAILIFILAGFLGISVFNLSLKEPLLPMLSGLFGASSLITSISKKQEIPEQKVSKFKEIIKSTKKSSIFKALFASSIASPICSLLPGMGSGEAAVIGSEVTGDLDRKEFLILLGAINTLVMGFSFLAIYSIGKGRTGSAVAVSKLLPSLSINNLLAILIAILISGILASFLTIFSGKSFSKNISKISYKKLSIFVLFILCFFVILFSGWLGFLVFLVSAFLGLVCIFTGIRRIHLMGCLLAPTILYYIL